MQHAISRASPPAQGEALGDDAGFGVYIHWPFCAQKCPYCDFNSHVRHGGPDEGRWLAALKRELSHIRSLTDAAQVSTVFLGGGTPSLMQPETVAAILDHIAALWSVVPGAEITLEANPGSVEAGRFAGYRTAGVNRVSLGVQSLRDRELERLGRIHTVAEAKAALAIAGRTFDRVSFDLIYARPGQEMEDWRTELREALQMAAGHLSLYQLTIEPETVFEKLHTAGKLVIPDPDRAAALYDLTQEMTAAAGLPAYEISNHAAAGEESRHNLIYWRYGSYAGAGPGAHGRLLKAGTRRATETLRNPETWAESVETSGHGLSAILPLSRAEEADEMLLMGLRLLEGLDLGRLERMTGLRVPGSAIGHLENLGMIERLEAMGPDAGPEPAEADFAGIRACLGPGLGPASGKPEAWAGRIRATGRGRFVLNEIVRQLSAGFERPDQRR